MAPISLIINPNGSKYATVGGLNNEQNVVFLLWNTKKTCVIYVKPKKSSTLNANKSTKPLKCEQIDKISCALDLIYPSFFLKKELTQLNK